MTIHEEIQNMNIDEMANFLLKACDSTNQITYNKLGTGFYQTKTLSEVKEWLKQDIKPSITIEERIILSNTSQIYKWIARDKDGSLHLFTEKPYKDNFNRWVINSGCLERLNIFNHLYKFIRWDNTEPYCIQDLLKGE